jgi:hypothetical protein
MAGSGEVTGVRVAVMGWSAESYAMVAGGGGVAWWGEWLRPNLSLGETRV